MSSVSARLCEENDQLKARLAEAESEVGKLRSQNDLMQSQLRITSERKMSAAAHSQSRLNELRVKLETAEREISVTNKLNEKSLHEIKIRDEQLRRAADDIAALQRRLQVLQTPDTLASNARTCIDKELKEERRVNKELVLLLQKLVTVVDKSERVSRLLCGLQKLDTLQARLGGDSLL